MQENIDADWHTTDTCSPSDRVICRLDDDTGCPHATQWNTLEQKEYVRYFQGFLLIAKGNAIVTALTFASFVLPVTFGIIHLVFGNTYQGVIMLAAGIVFFMGCFGVTILLNFPIYTKVMRWENVESATDWQDVRRRFYILNVIRMISAIVSFLLLGMGR